MKEEDKNSKFFHRTIKIHNTRNKILMLQNEEGAMIENYNQVESTATNFIANLFTEPNPL